jgi:hypothetical protein
VGFTGKPLTRGFTAAEKRALGIALARTKRHLQPVPYYCKVCGTTRVAEFDQSRARCRSCRLRMQRECQQAKRDRESLIGRLPQCDRCYIRDSHVRGPGRRADGLCPLCIIELGRSMKRLAS